MCEENKDSTCNCDKCTCFKDVTWMIEQCHYYIGKEYKTNDLWVIEGMHDTEGIVAEYFGTWEEILAYIKELRSRINDAYIQLSIKSVDYLIFNKEKDKNLCV